MTVPARRPAPGLPAARGGEAEAIGGLDLLAMAPPALEARVLPVGQPGEAAPEPTLPGELPAMLHAARREAGVPTSGPAAPRTEAADVSRPDSGSILGDAARLGGVRTAFTPGHAGAGMPRPDVGQAGIPVIATRGPAVEFHIAAPGELAVPENLGAGTVPEVLRNPSELSDAAIEGLGGSRETQAAIGRALDSRASGHAGDAFAHQ